MGITSVGLDRFSALDGSRCFRNMSLVFKALAFIVTCLLTTTASAADITASLQRISIPCLGDHPSDG